MPDFLIVFGAKYLLWILITGVLIWFLKQSRENKKKIILFGIVLLPIIFAVSRLAGKFYYDPRPFVVDNFIPLIPHEPDNGFPSDHTLLTAALAVMVYFFSKKASWIIWFLTILIGVSRVLAGIHHFVDIAGSVAIAILVGFLIRNFNLLFKKEVV